jgi:hypothetical protein
MNTPNPTQTPRAWPVVDIVLENATTGTIRGRRVQVPSGRDLQQHLLSQACTLAKSYGRSLRVRLISPTATTELVAEPGGRTTVVTTTPHSHEDAPEPEATPGPTAPAVPPPALSSPTASTVPAPATLPPVVSPVYPPPAVPPLAVSNPAAAITPPPVASTVLVPAGMPPVVSPVYPPPAAKPPVPPPTSSAPAALPVGLLDPRSPVAGPSSVLEAPSPWYVMGGGGDGQSPATLDPLAGPYIGEPARLVLRPRTPLERLRATGSMLRRNPLPGLVLTAVGAAAVVGALAIPQSQDQPTAAAAQPSTASASRTAGQPRSAPVAASPVTLAAEVPGWRTQPSWAHRVYDGALVDVGQDALVVTRSPAGQVVGIDAGSGKVRWWIPRAYTSGWVGPRLTRIDGELTVALTNRDQLIYWPVPDGNPGRVQDDPVTVTLPVGATLTWVGPSPLILLGPGSVAVVHEGALQLVALPSGARPLVADGTDVLATLGATWVRAQAGASPASHTIATPSGATGRPVRVEAVSASYLLAVWAKPAAGVQTVALVDVATGKTLFSMPLPAGVDVSRGPLTRQVGGSLLGVGTLVVDTDAKRLKAVLSQYKIVSLAGGHVWATDTTTGRTVDIRTRDQQFQVNQLPDGAAAPFATTVSARGTATSALALVMTPTAAGPLLQALPAT